MFQGDAVLLDSSVDKKQADSTCPREKDKSIIPKSKQTSPLVPLWGRFRVGHRSQVCISICRCCRGGDRAAGGSETFTFDHANEGEEHGPYLLRWFCGLLLVLLVVLLLFGVWLVRDFCVGVACVDGFVLLLVRVSDRTFVAFVSCVAGGSFWIPRTLQKEGQLD